MDIDKDDLAVLSARMTKEEMDRVHRLLHEWGVGPADNFPVQFTLLTSAQLLAAASVPEALALLKQQPVDMLLLDLKLPGGGGLKLLSEVKECYPRIGVVVMTAFATVASAVEAR